MSESTNSKDELEKIAQHYEYIESGCDVWDWNEDWRKDIIKWHNTQTKHLLQKVRDEVIGEDSDVTQFVFANEMCMECGCPMQEVTENNQRKTQRQAIDKLEKEMDETHN